MKNALILFFVAITASNFSLLAQNQYSYISDRKFVTISDLIGYQFVPGVLEIRDELEKELRPGSYTFGVTGSHLYVQGEKYKGVYNINNINTTEYGFKLTTMNARSAMQTGHLKVILNENKEAIALIFRRSSKDKEAIFHMPQIEDRIRQKEKEFFTDLGEVFVSEQDSIWGTSLYPMHVLFFRDQIQQRYVRTDSVRISFEKHVEIVEKEKKKSKKKKKRSAVDSLSQDAPIDSLEVQTKMIETYFIKRKHKVHYDDGNVAFEDDMYEIKRFKMREDEEASDFEEKFQIEFVTDSGESIFLYLFGDKSVSSLEMMDRRYLMRGY